MRSGFIGTIGHESLQIRAVLIEFSGLCYRCPIQGDRALGEERMEEIVTAVKFLSSKAALSDFVNLCRIYSLIFRSVYVSLSAGIENSKSLCSTEAMVL